MKIISFYSYKGGVGRSLLVANLAAYLCHYKERRILLIDWDLEAPGLHYYFNRADLKNKGIIELLGTFVTEMQVSVSQTVDKERLPTFEDDYIVEGIEMNGKGQIDLITAGLYDQEYTQKINNFNWEKFYKSFDGLTYIEYLKQKLKEWTKYDYIFIDSRTGVNDYWGIINIQIPDVNIFVIAPSKQNFQGVSEIADKIQYSQYVKDGKRRAIILPILSRLDPLNNQKEGEWFGLFRSKFQPLLENFLKLIYQSNAIGEKDIDKLINSTLLNYKTDLSYGEQVLFNSKNKKIEYNTLEKKYQDIASIIEFIFGKDRSLPDSFNEESLHSDLKNDKDQSSNISVQGIGNSQINITNFLGKSSEYNELVNRKEELETLLSLIPLDNLNQRLEISRKIEEQENLIESFEQDVKRLAETFTNIKINTDRTNIEINTDRLRKAKSLIELGKFSEARLVLETDALELFDEQKRLLEERERIVKRSIDFDNQLKSNAEQFLILAQTVALEPTLSNRFESARKYYEASIKSFSLAENLLGYASFLQQHNRFKDAESYLSKYLLSLGQSGESRAKGLGCLAVLHLSTNNFFAAGSELKEALAIYRRLAKKSSNKYISEIAQTYTSLGLFHMQMSEFQQAEVELNKALETYQSLANNDSQTYLPNVATVLNNLGSLHYNLNELDRAKKEFEQSLSIYRELAQQNPITHLSNVATALCNIGAIHYDQNYFEEAEAVYIEALKIQRDLANQNPYTHLSLMFGILNNLGNLYRVIHKFEESVNCFTEALEIYQRLDESTPIKYSPHIAFTLNNLGILYLSNNQLLEAEKALMKSYQIYKEVTNNYSDIYRNDLARVLNNLGALYSENKNLEIAEKYYQESIMIYRKLAELSPQPYLVELAKILINLAIFYLKDSPNREKSLTATFEAEKILGKLKMQTLNTNKFMKLIQTIFETWSISHTKTLS